MPTYNNEILIEKARGVSLHHVIGVTNHGRRISMRCPFHNEKTPSFCLYPDGSYYCFGCAKGGNNAIDFVMALGATFPEAIKELENYIDN
jgi:DNA primase